MNKQNQPLKSPSKEDKMLFNSDGFEFLMKFIGLSFRIIGSLLFMVFEIIMFFLGASSSNKKKSYDDEDKYVSLDPLKTNEENKLNGTGYFKNK